MAQFIELTHQENGKKRYINMELVVKFYVDGDSTAVYSINGDYLGRYKETPEQILSQIDSDYAWKSCSRGRGDVSL